MKLLSRSASPTLGLALLQLVAFDCARIVSSQNLVDFTLVDAATNAVIRTLNDGDEIDLSSDPSELTVVAVYDYTPVSVALYLDSHCPELESFSPFALGGHNAGDFTLVEELTELGEHTITATPYARERGKGNSTGPTFSITINTVERSSSTPSESVIPSNAPSNLPSYSSVPSDLPSSTPSSSLLPSTQAPSQSPTETHSSIPSASNAPSYVPTFSQTSHVPSHIPSVSTTPSTVPSDFPSISTEPSTSRLPSSSPSESTSAPTETFVETEAIDLVRTTDAEFVAVQNGLWDDPATWNAGLVPDATGHTYVPAGIEVTLDVNTIQPIYTLNIDGTVVFENYSDTKLEAEFIRVGETGLLQIGRGEFAPVDSAVTAEIIFTGEASPSNGFLSNGLVSEAGATILMHGATKTPFVAIPRREGTTATMMSLDAGSDKIVLDALIDISPAGWQVGDEIMISGITHVRDTLQDERFRVRALTTLPSGDVEIALGTLTDSSIAATLIRDHRPLSQANVYLANLSRNIVLRSASSDEPVHERGHVLLKTYTADIQFVEFRDMGRTEKHRHVEDGLDEDTDEFVNHRGRYALHFHRNLDNVGASASTAAVVLGSVANTGPGWGFVSHSSNVNFYDNVAYGMGGAGFVSEAGDELGTWQRNLAAHAEGDGSFHGSARFEQGVLDDNLAAVRIMNGDLAFSGDGFWLHSPGVVFTDNIATDCDGHGISVWTQGLYETDREQEVGFRTEYLTWDSQYRTFTDGGPHSGRAVVQDISMKQFENNEAYASFIGFRLRFHNNANRTFRRDFKPITTGYSAAIRDEPTTFGSVKVYNCEYGAQVSYVNHLVLNGLEVYHDDTTTTGEKGLNVFSMRNGVYNDLVVSGYAKAVDLSGPRFSKGVEIATYTLQNPQIDIINPDDPIDENHHYVQFDDIYWGDDYQLSNLPCTAPRICS